MPVSVDSERGRSVAVWFGLRPAGRVSAEEPSAELHFNFWRMPRGPKKARGADFLDIGIMISNGSEVSAIHLFLPVNIKWEQIEDLGHLFSRARIAVGIFNEGLVAQTSIRSSTIDLIRDTDKSAFCRVASLSRPTGGIRENVLEVEEEAEGTVLTITSEALDEARAELAPQTRLYFRLRLNLPIDEDTFVRVVEPEDRFLLSGFESVEYTDFRLNEARNLPESIERKAAAGGRVPIVSLNFLLVVGVTADVVGGHRAFHKCRLLETELWSSYFGNGSDRKIPEGMVIYHWKEPDGSSGGGSPITDFSAFVKLRLRRSQIGIYVSIALALGAVGGVGGNFIWWLIGLIC